MHPSKNTGTPKLGKATKPQKSEHPVSGRAKANAPSKPFTYIWMLQVVSTEQDYPENFLLRLAQLMLHYCILEQMNLCADE
jgi:hypothetical protein